MKHAILTTAVLALAMSATPRIAFADPPAPVPAPTPTPTRTNVALVSAGIAVAAATAAAVFGVLALQNKNEFQSSPTYARADDGSNDAAYADGAIALAVAAGVTSLVLFLTHDPQDAGAPAASTAPIASPFVTALGAGAVLRF
jgi:hypothetical protein